MVYTHTTQNLIAVNPDTKRGVISRVSFNNIVSSRCLVYRNVSSRMTWATEKHNATLWCGGKVYRLQTCDIMKSNRHSQQFKGHIF